MSSGATRWVVRRVSASYIPRLNAAVGSTNSWMRELPSTTSWVIAVSRPSVSAPSATCWTVAGRYPTRSNICWRVSAYFTVRPGTARATSAVSTVFGCVPPLDPNPPPTCGATTSTSSSASPNAPASACRVQLTAWVASCTTSRPPSQTATVVCGSIGWWCSIDVR